MKTNCRFRSEPDACIANDGCKTWHARKVKQRPCMRGCRGEGRGNMYLASGRPFHWIPITRTRCPSTTVTRSHWIGRRDDRINGIAKENLRKSGGLQNTAMCLLLGYPIRGPVHSYWVVFSNSITVTYEYQGAPEAQSTHHHCVGSEHVIEIKWPHFD